MCNKYFCVDKKDWERKCEIIEARGIQVDYCDLFDAYAESDSMQERYDGYEKIYLVDNRLFRIAENYHRHNGPRYVAAQVLGADNVSHDIRNYGRDYFTRGLGVSDSCYRKLCEIYHVEEKD